MTKILIVDGYSLLFRGYHATANRLMMNKEGLPTNAVYAFFNMFYKAIEQENPDAVVVAFDAGKKTFRNEMFQDYKGTREKAPEQLLPQFELVRQLLKQFAVPYIELDGYEADDIIGTLSAQKNYDEVKILSGDKDLLQLVNEHVSVLLMQKGGVLKEMTPSLLLDEMGLTPSQIIDYKALCGDTADNIPGVKNIGDKTAIKLLTTYQDLDTIYQNIDHITGKVQTYLSMYEEDARLSYQLATIYKEVPLPNVPLAFNPNYKGLIEFFIQHDMNSLKNRFMKHVSQEIIAEEEVVVEKVQDLKSNLDKVIYIALDVTGDIFYDTQLHGIFVGDNQKCYYISESDLENASALKELLCKKQEHVLVTYDAKFVMHVLRRHQLTFTFDDDVMLCAYINNSTLTGLDKILNHYQCTLFDKKDDTYTKGCKLYQSIVKIYAKAKQQLVENEVESVYNDIEMPLLNVLYDMESQGICVDVSILDEIAKETYEKIQQSTEKIYALTQTTFNINSPKQLAAVLYDQLQLPSGKKRSTDIEQLESLKDFHPVIPELILYRKYQKIYSTYADGLKKYVQPDHRIYSVFNQAVSQTGRLSSTAPNLQNISIKDEVGKKVRKAFLPSADNILISSDYSQIELRVLAHMADEQKMIQAFLNHEDIHIQTAKEMFHTNQVSDLLRRQAKAINFGIVYGISAFGLSKQVDISVKSAQSFIDNYNRVYPNIEKYMESVVKSCEKTGVVETLFKRKRYIPEILSKTPMLKAFGKRAAMNAPIQGSAADIIKLAMIRIYQEMKKNQLQSKLIIQIHDELIFDVVPSEIEKMKEIILKGMTEVCQLKVPLVVDMHTGHNLLEAKE